MVIEALISWVSGYRSPRNMTLLTSRLDESWREAKDLFTLQVDDLVQDIWRNGIPWHILYYPLVLLLIWGFYKIALQPLNRVRSMEDIGWGCFAADNGKSLAEMIRTVQRLRKKGELPPSYPNGWFAIAESRSIAIAQVVPVQALGESLAVFRGQDGKTHVIDAYCPHLGANMAVGGVVKGDRLECPFHGWQFEGEDGSCSYIPNCTKVPKTASVKRWVSREINGTIFVWHDAEGRSPLWEIPEIQEVNQGSWSFRGRTSHEVLAHIQEIPENGADLAHLRHLHVPNIFKGSDLRDAYAVNQAMDVAQHVWEGEWKPCAEPDTHKAELEISHSFAVFGGKFKLFKMTVRAEQIGPGLVHLHFYTNLGSGVLIQTVTPIEPLRQRIIHQFYSSPTFIAPYAKLVLLCEAYHVERDIMIWNNKQYMNQPLYVKDDRFIKKFRSWYSQFYSTSSQEFQFRKENLDW